jgi:lipid-binding SYLF domain-containing protein
MRRSERIFQPSMIQCVAITCLAWLFVINIGARVTSAATVQDAQQLVEKSLLTFNAFVADKEMGPPLQAILKEAKGVLIYPELLEGGLIFGVAGGSGTFLVLDPKTNTWAGPAFYTIGQVGFGLILGGRASEMVMVALTDRGVSALLNTSTKFSVDAAIALGPVGAGAEAATANLSADIISYSRNKGLFAKMSLNGAVVATRDALNAAYYGKEVTPTQILIQRSVTNQHARGLIEAVSNQAGGMWRASRSE